MTNNNFIAVSNICPPITLRNKTITEVYAGIIIYWTKNKNKTTLHLGFNGITRQLAIRHNTMIWFL